MRAQLAVIADAVNVSADGKLNILGEFNTIWHGGDPPVIWPRMFFAAKLEASGADCGRTCTLSLRVLDDDSNLVAPELQVQGNIPPTGASGLPNYVPLILEIRGATFADFGTYIIELRIDNTIICSTPLYIRPLSDMQPQEG